MLCHPMFVFHYNPYNFVNRLVISSLQLVLLSDHLFVAQTLIDKYSQQYIFVPILLTIFSVSLECVYV